MIFAIVSAARRIRIRRMRRAGHIPRPEAPPAPQPGEEVSTLTSVRNTVQLVRHKITSVPTLLPVAPPLLRQRPGQALAAKILNRGGSDAAAAADHAAEQGQAPHSNVGMQL